MAHVLLIFAYQQKDTAYQAYQAQEQRQPVSTGESGEDRSQDIDDAAHQKTDPGGAVAGYVGGQF